MSEELPHLDVLESVHAACGADLDYASARRRIFSTQSFYFTVLLVAALIALSSAIYYKPILSPKPIFLMLAAIALAWLPGWLLNIPNKYFYFETSPEGFLARGFWRRRFIPWVDVERTVIVGGKSRGQTIAKLVTHNLALRIPEHPCNWQMIMLQASMRQHLRELNKVEDYLLPCPARLLWGIGKVAGEREIDWACPRQSQLQKGTLAIYFVLTVIAGATSAIISSRTITSIFVALIIATAISLFFYLVSRPSPKRARRVRVNEDGVNVDTKQGSVILKWSDIKMINWAIKMDGFTLGHYLTIGSDTINAAKILYIEFNTESKDALLAIINKLDINEHPELLGTPDSLFE